MVEIFPSLVAGGRFIHFQQLMKLLVFHLQTLIFFEQKNQFFFSAPNSAYIVPICSSIWSIC
jgi:hypothetical protein